MKFKVLQALSLIGVMSLPVYGEPSLSMSMLGKAKYADDFKHFDYVNPNASQGGTLNLHYNKSFDSLNPYCFKGEAAPSLLGGGIVYATLFKRSKDEPFSLYGWIAESVDLADDRSWMIVTLRKEATFEDGTPIRADDVIATDHILKTKGNPARKMYQARVKHIEKIDDLKMKFTFDTKKADRETPLMIGLMPVLSKKFIESVDFDKSTKIIPNAAGPYKVHRFVPGEYVEYKRIANYWGDNLPINKGQYNFETIRYDVVRDRNVAREMMIAAKMDVFQETDPLAFDRYFKENKFNHQKIEKVKFQHRRPFGMFGLAMNFRREPLNDERVREAMRLAFDYEWINKNYFQNLYKRSKSFFNNCDMEAGQHLQGLEKQKLESIKHYFKNSSALEHLDEDLNPQESIRKRMAKATHLLKDAGFELQKKNGVLQLISTKTGKPLTFELIYGEIDHERPVLAFKSQMAKIGITITTRFVDSAQFSKRRDDYNYDLTPTLWGVTLSPGHDLFFYFGSESAEKSGTRNYMGLKCKAVDELIHHVTISKDQKEYVANLKALDRVLRSHKFVVPWGYWDHDYFLHTKHIQLPAMDSKLNQTLGYLTVESRFIDLAWDKKSKKD
jgi:microcin C transport system substrate-binding protein